MCMSLRRTAQPPTCHLDAHVSCALHRADAMQCARVVAARARGMGDLGTVQAARTHGPSLAAEGGAPRALIVGVIDMPGVD